MRSSRRLPSWQHLLLIGGVAVACGAMIVVGVVWERSATRDATNAPAPSTVVVGVQALDWSQSVVATFSLTKPLTLASPIGGVVTAVLVDQTTLTSNGVPVLSVDDKTIRAVTGAQPLFRSLSVGDTGDDVTTLSRLLLDLRYLSGGTPTNQYTAAVATAVRQYQQEANLSVTGTFDPESVIFVPTATTVSSLDVQVGQRIDAGTAIAATAGVPTAVRFSTDNQDGLAHLRSGDLTLQAGGSSIRVDGLTPSTSDLTGLNKQLRELAAAGSVSVDGPSPETGTSTEVFRDLLLSLRTPQRRGTVPISAIHASPSGEQCVFVLNKRNVVTARRIDAAAASTRLGTAFVPADLAGARIVRDASTAPQRQRSRCA